MPDLRAKALNYLRDGLVIVLHARCRETERQPFEVIAVVRGYTGVRRVELADGQWSCTCQGVVTPGSECAHRAAVALTTGHPSAAAKPAKAKARRAA